jgi:hypothetical protein
MQGRIHALVVGCLLVASTAFAADVDGTWAGTLATPMGDVPITFVFKADGDKLTGHMIGMDNAEIPIVDGKVEGDRISYVVRLDFGGMPFEMIYKGVVAPTEIKLEATVFDMPFELVVRKAP